MRVEVGDERAAGDAQLARPPQAGEHHRDHRVGGDDVVVAARLAPLAQPPPALPRQDRPTEPDQAPGAGGAVQHAPRPRCILDLAVVSVDHQAMHHAADQRQPVVDLDVVAARAQLRGHAAGSRIVSGANRGGEDENPHGWAGAALTGMGPELRRRMRPWRGRTPGRQYSLKLAP